MDEDDDHNVGTDDEMYQNITKFNKNVWSRVNDVTLMDDETSSNLWVFHLI